MGGQACILYGAAEFSHDVDVAVLASEKNIQQLRAALLELSSCGADDASSRLRTWAPLSDNLPEVARALRAEEDAYRAADQEHWRPLRAELYEWRRSRRKA